MHYTILAKRHLLMLQGEDTVTFLQGLISNDVRKLEQLSAIYATLLSPQGKYLHDFFLTRWENKIWMDSERAADLRKRLMLYKLRSKITIDLAPENTGVVALWGKNSFPAFRHAQCFSDPRLPALGARVMGDVSQIAEQCKEQGYTLASEADYERMRLALGVPGSDDLIFDKSFLLEWGIDQLHGVDYQKGCYVGQEVTARTHYRGHVKKAPYIIRAGHALPQAGAVVYCGEAQAGELRSSIGDLGLAILRMEEVEKSKISAMPLRVGDQVVTAELPGWFVPAQYEAGQK